MAPKNLASTRRRPPQDDVHKQSDLGADCDYQGGAAKVNPSPPSEPKFTSPLKQPQLEPDESGSACSSPSASGFIIVPSQKPARGERKKKKKNTPASSSKVFSDDDVISLLKGLAVFWANGKNNKWAEFHLFVKDDLGNHFTKIQLSEKIRSLKKKFERARLNGGRIDLSDPHESAVFELSKALWGDEKDVANEMGQMDRNEDEVANAILADREEVVEDEGSKKKKKKRKQVDENSEEKNTRMKKQGNGLEESPDEGDVRDAANTILSIRKLLGDDDQGNKKTGKKKRKQGYVDEGDEKKELVKEEIKVQGYAEGKKKAGNKKKKQGDERYETKELVEEEIQVEGCDEGSKRSSKKKQVDGEINKKRKKTKLVDECGEENKSAGEEKEVDEEVMKEVDQHGEEEVLKEGKQVDEDEQRKKASNKQKGIDGHDEQKGSAKDEKQVNDHPEEKNMPVNQDREKKLTVDHFQYAYPLLCASFNMGPKVAMDKYVLIGRENAEELEEKWREVTTEMHRLELKRLDWMNRQGK